MVVTARIVDVPAVSPREEAVPVHLVAYSPVTAQPAPGAALGQTRSGTGRISVVSRGYRHGGRSGRSDRRWCAFSP